MRVDQVVTLIVGHGMLLSVSGKPCPAYLFILE